MKKMRLAMMLTVLTVACGAVAQTPAPAPAATTDQSGTDTNIALLRSDVQANKNDIIAHTMQLNDTDAKAFWPLYREYASKQQTIGDQRVSIIKDYADTYDTMDDAKADALMDRLIKFYKERNQLRADYYPKFKKAIGAKQAAKFFQVDNRLDQIIDLQISSSIPIIQ